MKFQTFSPLGEVSGIFPIGCCWDGRDINMDEQHSRNRDVI